MSVQRRGAAEACLTLSLHRGLAPTLKASCQSPDPRYRIPHEVRGGRRCK